MNIKELNSKPDEAANEKLKAASTQFDTLLQELRKRELPIEIIELINNEVDSINSASEETLQKQLRKSQSTIVKHLEKELKLVSKNHYRNTWLAIGMATFGVPMGVVFGMSLGNMAYLGLGLPLGMVIGMAIGANLDKKALENGNQLDIELKH